MASVTPQKSLFMIVYVCFLLLYHNSFKMISDTKLFFYSLIVYVLLSSKNQHKQQLVHQFVHLCLYNLIELNNLLIFKESQNIQPSESSCYMACLCLFYDAMYHCFPLLAWFSTLQICQTLMWLSKTGRGKKAEKVPRITQTHNH